MLPFVRHEHCIPWKRSSVSTDEGKDGKDGKDGKEGKEDGNGNKEGSVLGAASAQARTAQAGTAAVFAAVPQKKLPVDEEAEARQKAKHTGSWVRRMHQRAVIVVRCVVYKVV